ncbi:DUF2861 family protein [Vibrio ostreicida]|uniref:DUF2861 family protein n=1 Tax=Vibrio ostreicida TaxID=526588 RepID=A0ABT8BZW7_9VIBR|nr:DUF2861 family protein [Vibrio ostreicida]MDN3611939.1 DUF2861 family protein [Vibrio ostreicida]NPD08881.1 DUF2861 family protein [Vibrio ostreicida]
MYLTVSTFMIAMSISVATHSAWFTDTPLARTYQALLNQQPQLAWQELHIALRQHALDSRYWLPVKQEILRQSQCGQQLGQHRRHQPLNLSISLIKRVGLSSQGYQIKISAQHSSKLMPLELRSPTDIVLLSGKLLKLSDYQELETNDLLSRPESGIYSLRLGDEMYPIIVAIQSNQSWLTLDQEAQRIHITPPKNSDTCSGALASWQWFDKDYQMLGGRFPILTFNAPPPKQVPSKAKYLSAAVTIYEYQQGIRIEYIHRVAIPFIPSEPSTD